MTLTSTNSHEVEAEWKPLTLAWSAISCHTPSYGRSVPWHNFRPPLQTNCPYQSHLLPPQKPSPLTIKVPASQSVVLGAGSNISEPLSLDVSPSRNMHHIPQNIQAALLQNALAWYSSRFESSNMPIAPLQRLVNQRQANYRFTMTSSTNSVTSQPGRS